MTAHDYYVAAAYGISAIVLAATIGWTLLDYKARLRNLSGLEAQGIRRRSDPTAK